jgi:peroxiredoxin Q/BCP
MMKRIAAVSAVFAVMAALCVRAQAADPLAVGATAPNFSLPSQEDKPISLAEFKGKWVVLYFYPKDQTQGCTIEAHNFQNDLTKYDAAHAVVLGVSMDTVASHKEWCAKDTFSFKMLADPDHKVVDMYEGAAERKVASRQTFLINPQGKIVKVWPAVQVNHHSEEVLAELAEQQKH